MSYFKFINRNPRTLFGIIRYVKDEEKTCPSLMYGFGVHPETAFEEMDMTKRLWNKMEGRQYKQFFFSFDGNVILPQETLFEVGCEIGKYYADEYQILMVMHFNTDNIHIHYVLNTVNMITGRKFSMTKRDEYDYKVYINKILQNYGLDIIDLHDGSSIGNSQINNLSDVKIENFDYIL